MNKKLLMFCIPILACAMLVSAYVILSTTTHISITEGQIFEYYNWDTGLWETLPLNTGVAYDFSNQSIAAGDEYTIQYNATNQNARDIQYTMIANSPDGNVTLEFKCLASGVQYAVENEGTQIMTLYILNPAGTLSSFGIKEVVNAGAPLLTDVQISTTHDRSEVNSSIVFSTCP